MPPVGMVLIQDTAGVNPQSASAVTFSNTVCSSAATETDVGSTTSLLAEVDPSSGFSLQQQKAQANATKMLKVFVFMIYDLIKGRAKAQYGPCPADMINFSVQ